MKKILDILKLIRTVNCLLAMVGVWVGASFVWHHPEYYPVFMASLATFLVCAAGNIFNDYIDIEIDRINNPGRVLVIGDVTQNFALIFGIILNITGLLVALSVNLETVIVALAATALLFAYNFYLKRFPLVGNIIIAVLTGLTFLAGALAVDKHKLFELPGPLIPAVFAFLFHLVREIIKDIADIEGDKRAGIKSLPIIIGKTKSIIIAIILFTIMVMSTYYPILAGWFSSAYKIIAVYIVGLPLLAFLIFLWGNPSERMVSVGSLLLKIGMGLGLISLILA